jgi:hypothetical protein
MDKLKEECRSLRAKIDEKDEKIKHQKDQQQEALGRSSVQDHSKIDAASLQSLCNVLGGMAKQSADQGLCSTQDLQQAEANMQSFMQMFQQVVLVHGKTLAREAATAAPTVATLVQLREADIKKNQATSDAAQKPPPLEGIQAYEAVSARAAANIAYNDGLRAEAQAEAQAAAAAVQQQQQQQQQQGSIGEVAAVCAMGNPHVPGSYHNAVTLDCVRAENLAHKQAEIVQAQGTLHSLDANAIERNSMEAMAKRQGSIYVPQADVGREGWADQQDDEDDDIDDEFADWPSDWPAEGMAVDSQSTEKQRETAKRAGSPDKAAGSLTYEEKCANL